MIGDNFHRVTCVACLGSLYLSCGCIFCDSIAHHLIADAIEIQTKRHFPFDHIPQMNILNAIVNIKIVAYKLRTLHHVCDS